MPLGLVVDHSQMKGDSLVSHPFGWKAAQHTLIFEMMKDKKTCNHQSVQIVQY
jgi:hypothetical protein